MHKNNLQTRKLLAGDWSLLNSNVTTNTISCLKFSVTMFNQFLSYLTV